MLWLDFITLYYLEGLECVIDFVQHGHYCDLFGVFGQDVTLRFYCTSHGKIWLWFLGMCCESKAGIVSG